MLKFSRKKVAVAGAAAAFVLAMSAAAAFAAPVLQPGVTSWPGMSGTCTNCHKYATASPAPKAAAPKVAAPKATTVSHPYVSKRRHHAGSTLWISGFVSPRISASTATLTISVQKLSAGSWETSASLATTGTVKQSGKFKHKTNYTAGVVIGQAGRYRLRAKLVWTDTKGIKHTKWSKLLYVRIYK
jgi:hypothetical protein